MAQGSKTVVYAALAGNLLVAATKAVAAAMSGSSGMFAEAVHSFVDTGNEVLLLYGMRRAQRPPDDRHPFGYGRELYFWSFIVALLIFAVGSVVTFVEGVAHLRAPEPIARPTINYVVLGLSLLFEGGSWIVAFREFRKVQGGQGIFEAIRHSKDPPKFMVVLEDSAAIVGILFALVGTWGSVAIDPRFDGAASIGIAALLAGVSIVLLRESKGLLIGEAAEPTLRDGVTKIAADSGGVVGVNHLLTTHLAPNQVVAALSVDFEDKLDIAAVERIVEDIEARVFRDHPEIVALFVKPQSPQGFARSNRRRVAAPPEKAEAG